MKIIYDSHRIVENPFITVCVITYNHEKYIEECLESILIQKTDFPYEILINDDASNDNTPIIIERYLKLYPEKIRYIKHDENQHNLGKMSFPTTYKFSRGKYLALCEGDDYWTDPNKLQLQIMQMELHPEIAISFHSSIRSSDRLVLGQARQVDAIIPIEEIILGGGGFCPTQSVVLKSEIAKQLPDFFYQAPVGDYFLQILASEANGALYIHKTMSVYRSENTSSWTQRTMKNEEKKKIFYTRFIASVQECDLYLNTKYTEIFKLVLANNYFSLSLTLSRLNDYPQFKSTFNKYKKTAKKSKHRLNQLVNLFSFQPLLVYLIFKTYNLVIGKRKI